MPAPSETPIPTESQPTPVSPFTAASIEPGQQKAFSFQSSSGEEILYWLYVPEGYDQDRTWPLILSLHGTLGFEPSLDRVSEQSPQTLINPEVTFPFIVISPQAPNGPWSQYHAPVDELIGYLGESLSIDPEAQFLTGLSTGAIGAWQWALAKPDRFAGVASIAGGISTNPNDPLPENICLLKDLPVWIAISEIDERVPVESVLATVAALEECGSTVVQFTAYADLNHGESFTMAFAGPELYDWMLGLME
jgi:predicted peptidase